MESLTKENLIKDLISFKFRGKKNVRKIEQQTLKNIEDSVRRRQQHQKVKIREVSLVFLDRMKDLILYGLVRTENVYKFILKNESFVTESKKLFDKIHIRFSIFSIPEIRDIFWAILEERVESLRESLRNDNMDQLVEEFKDSDISTGYRPKPVRLKRKIRTISANVESKIKNLKNMAWMLRNFPPLKESPSERTHRITEEQNAREKAANFQKKLSEIAEMEKEMDKLSVEINVKIGRKSRLKEDPLEHEIISKNLEEKCIVLSNLLEMKDLSTEKRQILLKDYDRMQNIIKNYKIVFDKWDDLLKITNDELNEANMEFDNINSAIEKIKMEL